jgi:hypothetical protein
METQAVQESAGEPSADAEPAGDGMEPASRLGVFVRQFGRELIRPVRLVVWALVIAGVGFGIAQVWEPDKGLIAAAALFGFFLIFTGVNAYSHAEREFFRRYSNSRGLDYVEGEVPLGFSTGLFSKGRRRWSEQTMVGKLSEGREAVMGLLVYEEKTGHNPQTGQETTREVRHTVACTEVPELRGKIDALIVQPRVGFRFFDSAEDALRSGRHRVEVESDALDRRYEIFVRSEADENMARQIFSPKVIDWLAAQPNSIGFELEGGELVLAVKGHHKSEAPLDAMWQRASELAERLAAEGREAGGAAARPMKNLSRLAGSEGKASERIFKRRAWVGVAMMLCAGAGLWGYLDYVNEPTAAEEAAEDERIDDIIEDFELDKPQSERRPENQFFND